MHLKKPQYKHRKHRTKYIHDMMWEHEAGYDYAGKMVKKGGYQLPEPGRRGVVSKQSNIKARKNKN